MNLRDFLSKQLNYFGRFSPYVFCLFSVLSFYSCIDKVTELNITSEAPKITVESILIDNLPPKVYVGRTTDVVTDNLTFRIPTQEVTVSIFEDGELMLELQPQPIDSNDDSSLNPILNQLYTYDTLLDLQENSIYQLIVIADNLPSLTSKPTIYHQIISRAEILANQSNFESTQGECRVSSLTLSTPTAVGSDLWVELFLLNTPEEERDVFGRELFRRFISSIDSTRFVSEYPDQGLACDFVNNRLRALIIAAPTEYTTFSTIRENLDYDLGGVFTPPNGIEHNVDGGYGYFGLGSSAVVSW